MEAGKEASMVESREWYLAAYSPKDVPTSDHLKIRSVAVPIAAGLIPENHVIVEVLLISVDPYLRTRMYGQQDGLYASQYKLNEAISTFGMGRVIASKESKYQEGDIVIYPFLSIAEYCLVATEFIPRKIDPAAGIPLEEYLSSLGVPGFAAWVAIVELGEAKAGSNVFISAAAGGVGIFAGQLAKLRGCRVVGSTGSDEKVKLLKNEFGYDDAFNYKTESDLDDALTRYFPNGIDIYLDNVGGKMLEAVLNHVNYHARIPLCGMISNYNTAWTETAGVRNLLNLVGKEVRMEGYVISSFFHRFEDFAKEMEGYIREGKIKSRHTVYNGIESFLESLESIFSGANNGKVILQVKPYN